jgi:drug/metabolite transporter (DMT)-like permease
MRRVRTDHVAILTYVEPVSAIVFAALLLGEALTLPTVLGGLMVVAGGLAVARLEARVEGPEPVPIEAAGSEPR